GRGLWGEEEGRPSSWPASTTSLVSSGNVSIEWPGMNHVVLRSYLSNSLRRRRDPTSPAKRPREMSSGESAPPYEPSQPATASTSTPMQQKSSFAIPPPRDSWGLALHCYDMCALCGVLREEHWAEDGGRRGRTLRVQLLNRVLDHFGLHLDDWGGRIYMLSDRTGRSVVVANLGSLWVEAERFAGR